jgi:hypothetical protein
MNPVIGKVILVVFVLACTVGLVSVLVAVFNLISIPFRLKPGVRAWAGGNPLNYVLAPDSLTQRGLAARRRVGISCVVFLVSLAVGFAMALIVRALR